MISPKMLYTLLVLIYVTLSHEEDPVTDTNGNKTNGTGNVLTNAKLKLKKLLNDSLNAVLNYGKRAKVNLNLLGRGRYLKEDKNDNSEQDEIANDVEIVLNTAMNDYYNTEKTALYNKLLKLGNKTQENDEEQLGKFYDNAKTSLDIGERHWKKQWDGVTELLKSGVKLGW
uniref:Putative secreted protein n=1 Tax=Panstrongylus lignarius TaxID=156445 RepID=A0A224XM89_9HEMI